MNAESFVREIEGGICAPRGVQASAVTAGIKESGRPDMTLIRFEPAAVSAGVYTRNLVCAAPVTLCRERVGKRPLRAILVNSGNANACTGPAGLDDAKRLCASLAGHLGCAEEEVVMCSTGLIGARLPVDLMEGALAPLVGGLGPGNGEGAARAIMTTDTRPKSHAVEVDLPEGTVRIGGIAKGSGMIAPNVATMLAFIVTDAQVPQDVLSSSLRLAADETFNCITIDGDTSTNDTVLLAATGASGARVGEGESLDRFRAGLQQLCRELALSIVRDGEGVTRVVQIRVRGGMDPVEARLAARAVSESLLVKTAFNGGLPNWGRIFAAAGYSGARLDPERMSLRIGDVAVMHEGSPVEGWEEALIPVLRRSEFTVDLDLAVGGGEAVFWTTDLSAEYVRINADYRT